jgi:hypothetical protein
MSGDSNRFRVAYAILAGLILIRFLPLALGTSWLWGLGQLTLLPVGYAVAMALVGAVILVTPLFPRSELFGGAFANWFSHTCYDSKFRHIARGLVLLIAAIAFVVLRMPTHFLGDGYIFLANVGSDAGHWIKWSEGGAVMVALGVQSLLGSKGQSTAVLAFQIVSVVAGVVTIWFYFLIARVISTDPGKRLLTFVILLFSSSILLFFGYVESYPILWAPAAGFMYFGVRYSNEGKSAVPALACLLLATALHLQTAMFYPAMGFLLLSRGVGLKLYKRFRFAILAMSGLVVTVVGILFYHQYTENLAIESIFLYPFSGKPVYPSYAIFSARHLSDILNLFLLVYPLGLMILALALPIRRKTLSDHTATFLFLLSIGSWLFLFLVDPQLSMPRDWDLFSLCWLSPTLLLLHLIPISQFATVRRLALAVTAISVILLLPFLLVNLDDERSVAEIRQIIADNPEKSFGTMNLLGKYCEEHGGQKNEAEISRLFEISRLLRQDYPDFYKMSDALQMLMDGRRDEAYRLFLQTKPNKFSQGYHAFLSTYYLQVGKSDSALVHAKAVIQLDPYYYRNYLLLANANLAKGDYNGGIEALRRGLALNEQNTEFLSGLAQVNL